MKNKIIIPTILFIAVVLFSFFALLNNEDKTSTHKAAAENDKITNQIILFYGDGCPHCAVVEKYIKENNIKNKIPFTQKEVYYNKDNAKELEVKAKICGLSTDSIGIPFLWDGEGCLIGDQDIINFFQQKTREQQ